MIRQAGTRRLFIALGIDADVAQQLVAAQEDLKRDGFALAWEPRAKLHLTLHFLGLTEEARLAELEDAMDEVAAGHQAFGLELVGLGHFTRAGGREPTVVWAGSGRGTDEVVGLAGAVSRAIARIGLPAPGLPFAPHVTLGRPTDRGQADRLRRRISEEKGRPFGHQSISRFSLYESAREDGQPVYRILREFRLP